ncbi:MAG: hypothetical protein J0H74_18250 [Chitinophagaceae bacterium]|nr:hypothetical protein [Chitinophagaceae bacterium]
MEIESTKGEKLSLLRRLRNSVFPIKEIDHPIVRLGKNVGFVAFIILIVCVSFGIMIGISLAL